MRTAWGVYKNWPIKTDGKTAAPVYYIKLFKFTCGTLNSWIICDRIKPTIVLRNCSKKCFQICSICDIWLKRKAFFQRKPLIFKSSCIKVTFGNLRTFSMEKMVNFISNSTCTSFYNDCPNLQIWQASSLIFQGRLLLKAGPLSYPWFPEYFCNQRYQSFRDDQ